MISGIDGQNGSFLANLNAIENRIALDNQQITSGKRVNQASDDPEAVPLILEYQGEIDRIAQIQSNLNTANTDAVAADGAVQSASSILDQLTSIAAEGLNGTATATSRAALGDQVQQLENQLVSIANTQVSGRYIFAGDDARTQPYTFDWSSPGGVVRNTTAGSTSILRDTNGDEIVPSMTAQQIFDAQNPDATPSSANIFQAVYSLGQALQANDVTAAQNAADALKEAVAGFAQVTTFYGDSINWIQQATNNAGQQLTAIKQALSNVQDADIPTVATQLTTDQTALQASLSSRGAFRPSSLFNYFG